MILGIMKLVILSSLCLLSIAIQGKGERQNNTALILKDETLSSQTISKRSWGLALLQGVSTAFRLGNLGVSLTSAITKGCAFFPSICENVKAIEKMEINIKKEKEEFKKMYVQHCKDVLNFRTVVSNNGLIRFYINDTMKNIERLSDWQSRNMIKLEAFFPKSMELSNFANKSSFDDYVLTLNVGCLEYTLGDIQTMLADHQKTQLLTLAGQLLVEAAVGKFVTTVKKAYNQELEIDIEAFGIKDAKVNARKLTFVPRVFKQMIKNLKEYISSVKTKFTNVVGNAKALKKVIATEGWKGIKGSLKSTIHKLINKLKGKITFNNKPVKVESPKPSKPSGIKIGGAIISIIGDAVSIGLNIWAWKAKRDEVETAKHNYVKYLNRLRKEKLDLKSEVYKIKRAWKTEIRTFKDTSKSFELIMRNMAKHSEFIDVLGLSKLAVNNTQSLSAGFQNVRKDNIVKCQHSVLRFLRDNDYNLTSINEALRARNILYDSIIRDSSTNKGVLQMTEFLHTLYRYDASKEVRRFGQKLRKKDVVCTVAIIRQDKTEYDYYPLLPFRPRCEVNETLYAEMEKDATKEQNMKIMNDVIDLEFQNDPVTGLSAMLATIKNTYKILGHQSLTKFAKAITAQDVLCHIARKFTTLSEYDSIPLSHFRNVDCSAISDDDLKKIREKASKIKILHQSMVPIMKMCTSFKMCPCISSISMMTGASQEDIKAVIKRMDPKRMKYCGVAGCKCIDL